MADSAKQENRSGGKVANSVPPISSRRAGGAIASIPGAAGASKSSASPTASAAGAKLWKDPAMTLDR